MAVSNNWGPFLGVLDYNKEHNVLGSVLGASRSPPS